MRRSGRLLAGRGQRGSLAGVAARQRVPGNFFGGGGGAGDGGGKR